LQPSQQLTTMMLLRHCLGKNLTKLQEKQMQFDSKTTRNVAEIAAKIMAEGLKGDQHKIDANKNKKIDAHDFELLRKNKKVEEDTKLTESHFKVGDEVVCKASGMEGEVVKVDPKEEGKYYTVKREDGKTMKYAPDELRKEVEDDGKENMQKEESEQLDEYDSKNGRYVHKGTYGYAGKGAEHGETDYKKANDDEKAADKKKPARKGYGARQNYVRAYAKESFSGMLDTYVEGGLKALSEAYAKKKVMKEEPDNEQFTKEVEEQKKRNKGEIRNDKGVAKPLQNAFVREDPVNPVREETVEVELVIDGQNGYAEAQIEERTLTEPEIDKKEEIVTSMKKKMSGFKDRYGDRAKSVMYATATKLAKKD